MKPVVKVTLRKTWHTSVQYLSCLFSFPLPITTAFMNHFYPSPIAPRHSLSPYSPPQHSWSLFLYNILSTMTFVTITAFTIQCIFLHYPFLSFLTTSLFTIAISSSIFLFLLHLIHFSAHHFPYHLFSTA